MALVLLVGAIGAEPGPRIPKVSDETRAAIAGFYDYDPSIPLAARVVDRDSLDTGVRERVVFRGVRGFLVSAYLERPAATAAPAPVVLLLHGWSAAKDRWWLDGGYISGGDLRRALLAAGYAVFAVDAQAHGDRIAENDYGHVNDRSWFTVDDIVTQTARDCRRGLDYLAGRDDIDAERLGVVGYSMGGWLAFILAAVDDRIDVAVAVAPPTLAGEDRVIAPGNYAGGIDCPFLLLAGSHDDMCPAVDARRLHELLATADKDLVLYDAGHQLPAAYTVDAGAWLRRHLQ